MKTMIIENDDMVRYLLSELLYEMNVERTIECKNGENALQYIKRFNADRLSCIFVDISTKGTNCSPFLDELMHHSVFQDIPIFVLTNDQTTSADLKLFKHEICAIIKKPFNTEQIKDCLEMAHKIEASNPFLQTHAS